jgi:hypothetical protein
MARIGKKRKRSAVSGLPATKKIGKKTYTKSSCAKTKVAANSKAKAARKSGKAARVVKNPAGGYCLFTAGRKRKKVSSKRRASKRRK